MKKLKQVDCFIEPNRRWLSVIYLKRLPSTHIPYYLDQMPQPKQRQPRTDASYKWAKLPF